MLDRNDLLGEVVHVDVGDAERGQRRQDSRRVRAEHFGDLWKKIHHMRELPGCTIARPSAMVAHPNKLSSRGRKRNYVQNFCTKFTENLYKTLRMIG